MADLSLRLSPRAAKTPPPEPTPAKSSDRGSYGSEGFIRKIEDVRGAALRFSAHVPGLSPPAFSRSAFSGSDLNGGFGQVSTWA